MNVTVGLAFVAGLASFLSPCVLSLVPAYFGYLGGRAAGGESAA
jgi:cytochrome c-type biogenesis protein